MNYSTYRVKRTGTDVPVDDSKSHQYSGKRELIYIKMMLLVFHLPTLLNPLNPHTQWLIYCNRYLFFNCICRIKLECLDIGDAKQPR